MSFLIMYVYILSKSQNCCLLAYISYVNYIVTTILLYYSFKTLHVIIFTSFHLFVTLESLRLQGLQLQSYYTLQVA